MSECRLLCQFGGRVASHFISKLTRLKRRLLYIVLLGLALLLLQTSLTAAPLVKRPLAPPNTSSPQATLRSFVENVNKSHQILMAAYDQYLKEPGPFPSGSRCQRDQDVLPPIGFGYQYNNSSPGD